MDETPRLKLPLLQASQAQKHVTLNEALVLLDSLSQLSLASRTTATPPVHAVDGECYAIPAGATDEWATEEGNVAVCSNGGWIYVPPADGWRAWASDERRELVYSSGDWGVAPASVAPFGAAMHFQTVEAEHDVVAGGSHALAVSIPAKAMVFAVSGRVIEEITGTATSWRLGTAGADDRFGSGMGTTAGSYGDGLLGQPLTYYSATPITLSPDGGTFSGGKLRVALHYLTFDLPGV